MIANHMPGWLIKALDRAHGRPRGYTVLSALSTAKIL